MFSRVIKTFLVLICFVLSAVHASEEPKAAEAAPAAPVKSAEASYNEVQAKVVALEAKINSAEAEIQKLIVEKQHTKDPKRTEEIIEQMVRLHREMQTQVKEYDQQRALLRYRYPERGHAKQREYERIEVKSLVEMEDVMSLSSSVNKTMKKVRQQYEVPERPAQEGSKAEGAKVAPPSITDPVILKK